MKLLRPRYLHNPRPWLTTAHRHITHPHLRFELSQSWFWSMWADDGTNPHCLGWFETIEANNP